MCGLVGLANLGSTGMYQSDVDLFVDLLIVGSVRGAHGTGMLAINENGQRNGLKVQGNPYNLIVQKQFDEYTNTVKKPYLRVLAGHNRYATTGEINSKCAHPFYAGHISMMHNGTLREYGKFPQVGKVDSESFCAAIATMGVDSAIANMRGAYAIAFYDQKQKTFNLARNFERPLWVGVSEKDKKIIWASEKKMMEWAVDRQKMAFNFDFFELESNQLLSFPISDFAVNKKVLPFTGEKLPVEKSYKWSSKYGGGDADSFTVPASGNKNKKPTKPGSIVTSDGSKTYVPGHWVSFDLFDCRDLFDDSETNDKFKKYSMIGSNDAFGKDIEFKFHVRGKQKMIDLFGEETLGGYIKSIYTCDVAGNKVTQVWMENVAPIIRQIGKKDEKN